MDKSLLQFNNFIDSKGVVMGASPKVCNEPFQSLLLLSLENYG